MAPDVAGVLQDADLEIDTMRGSGAGGQHRNRTESAVRIRHRPTGLEARICTERSQHRNKAIARAVLEALVAAFHRSGADVARACERRALAGTGCRADKIRTYRQRDDLVTDHRSGRRAALSQVLAGDLQSLA